MLNPGDRIGDWIVTDTLGEGGMGAVYRAHNTLSEKVQAAVKILKPHNMGDARARFVREVELLASVQHNAVVRVLGCGEDETRGLLFMAMELLDGEELTDVLERGPLSYDNAAKYFKQLSEGLDAAHKKGVVHRDIKPQNILITSDGNAKLLDFGIAMQQGGTKLTKAGMVPGTIAYMPPEVFGGQRPDHRADIYALGLVLYESLTGLEGYPEDGGLTPDQNTVKMMGSKLSAEAFDPGDAFPDPIRELVKRATDPEPDTRLNDLTGFINILQTGGDTGMAMADLSPKPESTSDTFGLDFSEEAPHDTGAVPARAEPTAEMPSPAPASGGGMKWAVIAVVLLLLIAIPVAVVALLGGGVLAAGAGGAAVYMSGSEPSAVTATNGSSGPAPVGVSSNDGAAPAAPAAPAAKGWTRKGVPDSFPFSIPANATITNALSSVQDGKESSVVIYETKMDTQKLVDHYRAEAKAQNMQVYVSDNKNGAALSGIGDKSVLGCSIEEHRDSSTVSLSYMPDRG